MTEDARSGQPLRVVFFLHSLGYLRFFDPVLRELLARGHRVHLLFERDDHDANEERWLEEMTQHEGFGAAQTNALRNDVWRRFSRKVRKSTDLVRFHSETFRDAGYLVVRAEHRASPWFRRLAGTRAARSPLGQRLLTRAFDVVERSIPAPRGVERELQAFEPDVVVVCPHMTPGMRDSDYVKAARALGLRTMICIASWDNLSSKQQIHELPDRLVVWNETQKREAVELHGVPPERVVVTGAQPFDHWFSWTPTPRDAFARRIGIDPDRPYVLYVGGSLFPAEINETEWARRWLGELRRDPGLADVGVVFRPHPNRGAEWSIETFGENGNVAIWPPLQDQMPLDAERRADFFDSIFHSAAVFGLNTTAMIDATVIGRPVHSMLAPEFASSQVDVFHFDYLLHAGGGPVQLAATFDELREHLAAAVAGSDAEAEARRRRFVEAFVRPHGLDRPATPFVADAIEDLARIPRPAPERMPLRLWPVRGPLVVYVRIRPLTRLVRFKSKAIWETYAPRLGLRRDPGT